MVLIEHSQVVGGDVAAVGAHQPEKSHEEFRNYVDSARQEIVLNHYTLMRTHQTLEFVERLNAKYSFSTPRATMTIREAFVALEGYVDSSDPDVSLPNLVHMFQTAEGIREDGHPDWMQLVGLIHDMGKLMYLWGTAEDGQVGTAAGPQFALGGDTWVVGCRIPDCTVLPELNKLNPDMADPRYNTEYGIYEPNCGLKNLKFAYGHDEYLYQMLVANQASIPAEGMAMVRYHSLYPWHTGGAYRHLMEPEDEKNLEAVLSFNKYDLYTKSDEGLKTPIEKLWEYYEGIMEKYGLGGKLMW